MLSEVARQTRLDALWKHVFGPEHKPVKTYKPRIRHRNMRGRFPTEKCRSTGMIRTRLPLMLDGLVHLDTDPNVVAIAAYPTTFDFLSANGDGNVVGRSHIPDVGVLQASGKVVFVDWIPFRLQQDLPWLKQRTAELRLHLEQYGAEYAVHDERSIYIQPRFSNLNLMEAHKPLPYQHAGIDETCRAIMRQPLPSTIGELCRMSAPNALVARWEDEPAGAFRVVPEVNVVFTACMQLAYRGEIELDISRPFSPRTRVTRAKA
ncbi:hypothetical protein QA648_11025 [Rhizobium sp. CB3171]|uniref:hypothetical protein n=1 Tax=Rhizobium sp. CB3171 TaxID=3039157 RepID=UPI0024B227B2|nr:hypothetical protein [Rhizobium sp. CB3171]WFU00703.1 hypothetical protein QA648_11025 [Rhizobium sp. CB3171]